MREAQKSYGAATRPKSVVSRPTPKQRSSLHVTAAFNKHLSQQTSMSPRKPQREAMNIQVSPSEPQKQPERHTRAGQASKHLAQHNY